MGQPCFHASIEGAQHGAKSLTQFLSWAKKAGAAGAQPSNFLIQSSKGSGDSVQSSFHLVVTVEETSGRIASHTVGLPDYWRKGVKRYRIKQVLLAPDERSVVIVVEREEQDSTGVNIRYMVETLRP